MGMRARDDGQGRALNVEHPECRTGEGHALDRDQHQQVVPLEKSEIVISRSCQAAPGLDPEEKRVLNGLIARMILKHKAERWLRAG